MATIVIDKSNWSWKRIIKDSLLRVVNLAILKVYDKNSTGYVKVGRNTSLGQRLSIVMIGGVISLRLVIIVTLTKKVQSLFKEMGIG